MKTTLRVALIATLTTYMLIFTGGLVRVSGAGLGCPDWPKCFGRWIPPTSVAQLPPDLDPAQFNFTLAWIEYLNRLFGMVVGLFILLTALLTIRYFRQEKRIVIPAILAALLVAYVGWQGGQVVVSKLSSFLVSIHALFAIALAGLMLYVAQQIHYQLHPETERTSRYPIQLNKWIGVALTALVLQLILGTNLRSTVEAYHLQQPFAHGLDWAIQAGWLNWLHIVLGMMLIAAAILLCALLLLRSHNPSALVWQGAWALIILLILQGGLGFLLLLSSAPLLEVAHLWIASLLAGMLVLLHAALLQKKEAHHESP